MRKKYSIKFWVVFWLVAIVLLAAWFLFWEYKNKNYTGLISIMKPIAKIIPIKDTQKKELIGTLEIISELSKKEESTFLLLFQNRDELRPGGGYIGSFGVLKTKKGKIVFVDTHDTNVFDSRIATQVDPPKPMRDWLGVEDLELRDSNWSPDFKINAEQADYFYHLEGGQEKLDGVIALSSELLPSFLEIVGPVEIEGYPGVYNSENAVEQLEYQVEKGYSNQGIEEGKRKYIMKEMSKSIIKKAQALSWPEKKRLLNRMEKHLNEKDILIYFKDSKLQQRVRNLGWSGEIKNIKDSDFLMMVDANLGARKSDAVIERTFEYTVDFRQKKPVAELKIKYTHKGRVRDLLTEDYRTYLRILTPSKSWLYNTEGLQPLEFIDFDKIAGLKSFGIFHKVNLGKTKVVEFRYSLPEEFMFENYQLFIQKQSGINNLRGKVKIINKMGTIKSYTIDSTKDVRLKVNVKNNKDKNKKTDLKTQTQLSGSIAEIACSSRK
jgi:hypothetical protein